MGFGRVLTEKGLTGFPKGLVLSSQAWYPGRCHAEPKMDAKARGFSRRKVGGIAEEAGFEFWRG